MGTSELQEECFVVGRATQELFEEMVGLLAAKGDELCVCDIESHFELSQPTVSHHLRILREAGLVTSERRGTWVYYTLDRAAFAFLGEFGALVAK